MRNKNVDITEIFLTLIFSADYDNLEVFIKNTNSSIIQQLLINNFHIFNDKIYKLINIYHKNIIPNIFTKIDINKNSKLLFSFLNNDIDQYYNFVNLITDNELKLLHIIKLIDKDYIYILFKSLKDNNKDIINSYIIRNSRIHFNKLIIYYLSGLYDIINNDTINNNDFNKITYLFDYFSELDLKQLITNLSFLYINSIVEYAKNTSNFYRKKIIYIYIINNKNFDKFSSFKIDLIYSSNFDNYTKQFLLNELGIYSCINNIESYMKYLMINFSIYEIDMKLLATLAKNHDCNKGFFNILKYLYLTY
jgi:hypothetical protein